MRLEEEESAIGRQVLFVFLRDNPALGGGVVDTTVLSRNRVKVNYNVVKRTTSSDLLESLTWLELYGDVGPCKARLGCIWLDPDAHSMS